MYVPERVVPFETAVICLYITAFLQCRLSLANHYVLQSQTVGLEKWPFATEFRIFNYIHELFILFLTICLV